MAVDTVERGLYRHKDLARVLDPSSIAIVGASSREGSFGRRVLGNLHSFSGAVYPVNPNYAEIDGVRCHASLDVLPESPDCVIVATPQAAVEAVASQSADVGAGGLIVFASGFAELGTQTGHENQRRLVEISRHAQMPVIGPNTIGLCNFTTLANMTFGPVPPDPRPAGPAVGVVSQSGAVGQGLMQAVITGTAISHILTSGNSCDVDVADLVTFLADDPNCQSIACIFEGMSDPLRFVKAIEYARSVRKPVIAYKAATGEQGASAALSHTGSLSGSNEIYASAVEQAGGVLVTDLERLMETAAYFAKAPAPQGQGAAVVSTSGGHAVISADKAELHNVPLPQPSPSAREVLKARIPAFGSPRNPCDITAQVLNDPDSLSACMEALAADEAFSVLIHPNPVAYETAVPRFEQVGRAARKHGKFAAVVWMNQWFEGPGAAEVARNPDVALFRSMDNCFRTVRAWLTWHASTPVDPGELDGGPTPDIRAAVGARLRSAPHRTVGEHDAKEILAAYGVTTAAERRVTTADDAVEAAGELGYPVAMKVDSHAIPHKTDAGVVRLGVEGPDAVRAAFNDINERALLVARPSDIDGTLVQPMLPQGVEVVLGGRVDELFGPIVVVGMGGVLVEVLHDSALSLAPVSAGRAEALLRSLRTSRMLLDGFRGVAPVDLNELVPQIVGLSHLLADHRDVIAEVDVNPVICSGSQAVAADALIVLNSERDERPAS